MITGTNENALHGVITITNPYNAIKYNVDCILKHDNFDLRGLSHLYLLVSDYQYICVGKRKFVITCYIINNAMPFVETHKKHYHFLMIGYYEKIA